MRRVFLICALALLLVGADQSPRISGFLSSSSCPGTGCLTLSTSGLSSVSIQVTGTWSGTISFEASIDGATYAALGIVPGDGTSGVTSTTANGVWLADVGGLAFVRARMSAFTSGTAEVSIQGARRAQPPIGAFSGGGSALEGTETPEETEPPAADGVSVTPNASAGAFSTWVELIPSTSTDISVSGFSFNQAVSHVTVQFSVGVGALGAEVEALRMVVRAEVEANTVMTNAVIRPTRDIPSGSRVSIRFAKDGTDVNPWFFSLSYYRKPIIGNPVTTSANMTFDFSAALTPSGTAWANSNWFLIEASTATPWTLTSAVPFGPFIAAFLEYEFDIGVGGAGSEVPVATIHGVMELSASCVVCGGTWVQYIVPHVVIPAGSRVSARMRKEGTSVTQWNFAVNFYQSSAGFSKITTKLPTLTLPSAADGLGVTAPGGLGSPGSWVEFTASTSAPIAITSLSAFCANFNLNRIYEIGVGPNGAEVVVGRVRIDHAGQNGWHPMVVLSPALNIGSGVRVSVRSRSELGTTDQIKLGYIANPDFTQRTNNVSVTWPQDAQGVLLTPNGTAWANSSWVEIIADTGSTRYLITHIIVNVSATGLPRYYEIDLGYGAAGKEVVATTVRGFSGSASSGLSFFELAVPRIVPTQRRISVRFRGSGTATTGWRFSLRAVPD